MKILFLSNGNEYSKIAINIINKFDYNIIIKHLDKSKFSKYPENYDLGISFLYSFLVPEKEINKAKWINFHPAILPDYGGRNIAYHTIMNEESEAGGTIHYMDKTFDTGEIIDVKKFNINNMTAYEVYNKSYEVLIKLLKEYFPKLIKGKKVNSYKQRKTMYYKKMKINDFIEVSEINKKKILALTYPPHYPKIKIGNKVFNVILNEA